MKNGSDRKKSESLRLFNTFTKKKDVFSPLLAPEVKMYNCGPTVYNFAHIGNLRSYVFADTLRRTLEINGYSVKQVINITDVGHLSSDRDTGEDKVEKEAAKEGKAAKDITEYYTKAFFSDLDKLNIETKGTVFPKATFHIKEQIELVRKLEEKSFTYKIQDGIYFDTSKFKNYGKLGEIDLTGLKEGARVEANVEKKNPSDFALWKFSRPDEKRQQEWPSPWGIGFPGWHIECSAMSMKYLGETLDIHTGGIDHIPVHHNNEIAQSEAATGRQFSRYWMHNAFVNISGEKMAKSEGNFIRLKTLEDRGIHPLTYKYWLLTAHYRSPITFSFAAVNSAGIAFRRLLRQFGDLREGGSLSEAYSKKFKEIINDDLDTPGAISLIWQILKDNRISDVDKKATIIEIDEALGLNLSELAAELKKEIANIPLKIKELAEKREMAREQKDWKTADSIREEAKKDGYTIEDTPDGPEIQPFKS